MNKSSEKNQTNRNESNKINDMKLYRNGIILIYNPILNPIISFEQIKSRSFN